jgi:biotin carboxylase
VTERQKSILVIGSGTMQIPALVAAHKKELIVISADGNPDAPGRKYCDIFFHIDLKNKEMMLEKAREYHDEKGLDAVFTTATDFSTTVAYIAENLGLPGIDFKTALNCSDKGLMRSVFKNTGIPSPDFFIVDTIDELDQLVQIQNRLFPLVVKPVDNMGARGVKTAKNIDELYPAVEMAIGYSRQKTAIVEDYIHGPEYSIDALVFDGEITICGVADRHIYFPPYFVELGHTLPADLNDVEEHSIIQVFKTAVRALGINNGAAKGDLFMTKSGPVIGEIAARLSGGYMSGWTYPYSSGVDLTSAAIDISLGERPRELTPKKNLTSAERAFISIPGKVVDIRGLSESSESEGIQNVFLRIKPGEKVYFPSNNVEKCGNIISLADKRTGAEKNAVKALQLIRIDLEPGNQRTTDFLFKDSHFSAFRIEDEENRGFFKELFYQATDKAMNEPLDYDNDRFTTCDRIHVENYISWDYRTLGDCLFELQNSFPVTFTKKAGNITASVMMWAALIKGGLQAACWFLTTLEYLKSNNTLEVFIRKWGFRDYSYLL